MATKCGNPACNNKGISQCAACNSIKYCTKQCQTIHWKEHKPQCQLVCNNKDDKKENKKVNNNNNVSTSNNNTLNDFNNKLQTLKSDIQKSLQIGDFKSAIKIGIDGTILAKLLPEPASTSELVQLNLNIANAYMQLNEPANAEIYINSSVEDAERGITIRPNNPQAIEMLCFALGSQALWLCNANRLPEAYTVGMRGYDLSVSIYGTEDFRLYKAVRCLALIYEKQNNLNEMEKSFKRSYDLVYSNPSAIQETHILSEEFIQQLVKHSQVESAYNYSLLFYNNFVSRINKDDLKPTEQLILGDQSARLSNLSCRLNKFQDGERYLLDALSIREKALGPESKSVGSTLLSLAGISEAMNKPTNEIEKFLVRAYEIFKRLEGPSSYLANSTYEHIKRLRNSQRSQSDGTDGYATSVTSENSLRNKKIATTGSDIPLLDANDGFGRMKLASQFFESQEFNKAQILLSEAYKIFLQQLGPDHASTKAAKQNLEVVKQNSINQLWKELADEMIEKLQINDENSNNNENGSSKAEDDSWLFKEPEKTNNCVIS